MRLRRDEIGMYLSRQLDELDKPAVRRCPRDDKTGSLELRAIAVVELVPVPVPFLHIRLAVHLANNGALEQLGGIRAETHGAAHVALTGNDIALIGHRGDHRMWCRSVKLGGVRIVKAGQVAGALDDEALQTKAKTQGRQQVLAGVTQRAQLSFDSAN